MLSSSSNTLNYEFLFCLNLNKMSCGFAYLSSALFGPQRPTWCRYLREIT